MVSDAETHNVVAENESKMFPAWKLETGSYIICVKCHAYMYFLMVAIHIYIPKA